MDDIEKPDAKKSKMNSSVLQKQGELQLQWILKDINEYFSKYFWFILDSNVVRKTLGISKKKISQRGKWSRRAIK